MVCRLLARPSLEECHHGALGQDFHKFSVFALLFNSVTFVHPGALLMWKWMLLGLPLWWQLWLGERWDVAKPSERLHVMPSTRLPYVLCFCKRAANKTLLAFVLYVAC